ncbi:hypothetical protein KGM_207678 [Danaus plexippus plexippus]|uniref:Uncharacterized protein n=1 Tax=Danaus plexippus plexippus TaxID=278856 RepID=A0A212FDA3_DANPL|nr:hypothetical protein KGM_207678 [Danaus plexippus plexippus]
MQGVRHFYMTHGKKPNSYPIKSGYVYKQVNNQPPMIMSFGNKRGRERQFGDKGSYLRDATALKSFNSFQNNFTNLTRNRPLIYEAVKNIENDMLIKNPKREAVFEDRVSSNTLLNYEKNNEFLNDHQDVRTDSRNSYDGWPFFYRSPYEYEPMKFNREIEKAKDKRFLVEEDKRVIPVHEHIKDDVIDNRPHSQPGVYNKRILTTDNPMFGEQPFFSYVLNDYFDKTNDYDPLTFKDLSWGKEFDQEMPLPDIDDYSKNFERLNEVPRRKNVYGSDDKLVKKYSQTTKERNNNNNFSDSDNEQEDEESQHRQSYRNFKGDNDIGFKEFADYFANRFGSENHNNEVNYNGNKIIDKGENKKGFRKVYHKDEYQEETEFHDHNNEKARVGNNSDSQAHIGGLERLSHTQAVSASGSNNTSTGSKESEGRKRSDKSDKSEHQQNNEQDFKHYRDVAREAVLSNNADYIDNYMI